MFNWLIKLLGGIPKKEYRGLAKKYSELRDILEIYLKGDACTKSGDVAINNGAIDIIFPEGVKNIYIDTYRLNNAPVRVKVGVDPGKQYHIESKYYTEDVTKRHMILIGSENILYQEGRVHGGSSTYVPHPANIVWTGEDDGRKYNVKAL